VTGGLGAVFADLRPRASEVALLAVQDGLANALPAEQAQPVYLRDEVAQVQSRAPTPTLG
jgi:tRNA A37 threonylcarbamoyladenosine modification protein TsaB